MEPSSSSTPETEKLYESKEATIQQEFSGPKRKIKPKFSKKKKKINDNCNENSVDSSSNCCHQCKRNNRGQIVRCSKCRSGRYCESCITKWYPMMSMEDFELACPLCKGNCNCLSCLRLEVPLLATSRWKLEGIPSTDDISETAKHMIKMILPFMSQIHEEQKKEKTREAKIQGVSLLELKVEEAIHQLDEHLYCDKCKTYIPDLHRSCTQCSFNLCLACCREVCDGCLQGVQEEDVKLTSEWKLNEYENIPCPPKDMGGCGNGILALKHIQSEDYICSLFWRANALFEQHNLRDIPETPMQWCTCLNSCDMDNSGGNVRRAASRQNSNDNYLYSPTAMNIKDAELKHFQFHFFKGGTGNC